MTLHLNGPFLDRERAWKGEEEMKGDRSERQAWDLQYRENEKSSPILTKMLWDIGEHMKQNYHTLQMNNIQLSDRIAVCSRSSGHGN